MDLKYARDAIETNPNLTDKQRQDMLDKLDSKIDELNSKIDIINFYSMLLDASLGHNPTWFNDGPDHVMGKADLNGVLDFLFGDGSPILNFFEDILPNFHEFAVTHDGYMNGRTGLEFWALDFPTMPIAFGEALLDNVLHTGGDVTDFFNNLFD